jgi:uncharacterized protein (DUF736 family)
VTSALSPSRRWSSNNAFPTTHSGASGFRPEGLQSLTAKRVSPVCGFACRPARASRPFGRVDQARDTFTGEIKTLTLLRAKVIFRPVEAKSEKGPHYRVVVEGQPGPVELGAAWKRKSEAGREFLSVSLDDPALPRALRAALMIAEDGASANLIWSRQSKRRPKAD